MTRPRHAYLLASTALVLILAAGAFAQQAGTVKTDRVALLFADRFPVEMAPSALPPVNPPATPLLEELRPAVDDASPPIVVAEQPPDPLASLDPADRVIAEKLRDLLSKSDKFFSSRKERSAVEAFYQSRSLLPLWLDKGIENARAKAVAARLKHADGDGLEPSDYKTPNLGALNSAGPDLLAEAELRFTAAVLTYARHAQAGRFPYTRVSRNIELPQAPPDPVDVLGSLAQAHDAAKVLDGFSPQHEPYRRLKSMLAELRAKSGGNVHDRQIDAIIVNMERWRWYPRDLGKTHVLVNEPDFTLKVINDGVQVWTTRVVIGKPSMATPLLSETMKRITINPTWNVPPSIVHNEYLPALAQDPTVLARMGLRVSYGGGGVHISQPPGEGNALGRIRFNFPNRFLVYQHDTPDKYMFGHEVRAYSHGCMRVQDPAKYAEVLFNIARPQEHWTAEKVRRMYGTVEHDISLLPAQIWVHLTYQTAFVDDAGKLQIRRDVYNLDSRTLAAIKSERGIIDPDRKRAPEDAYASSRKSNSAARAAPLPRIIER